MEDINANKGRAAYTGKGGPALICIDIFHQLHNHLVDGVVPQIPSQLARVSANDLPLATEIVVVNIPSLAILQSQSLADLLLCCLHAVCFCTELKFFGERNFLDI